jgi:oxygen-dependent protoporphyrinogen oxidase
VTSVVLGFRREDVTHPCCGFGALIPHREGFGILGTIFSSALFPRRAPDGHVTLTTYVGGARRPEAALLPDGPLVDLVLGDLGRLFGVRNRPVFTHITRWPKAIPQYEVGYGRYKELLDRVETAAPGLFFAGHYRDGVALSDSLLAGGRAAARIRDHLTARCAAAAIPSPQSP